MILIQNNQYDKMAYLGACFASLQIKNFIQLICIREQLKTNTFLSQAILEFYRVRRGEKCVLVVWLRWNVCSSLIAVKPMVGKYGNRCGVPCLLLGIVDAGNCQNNLLRTVCARLKNFQGPK